MHEGSARMVGSAVAVAGTQKPRIAIANGTLRKVRIVNRAPIADVHLRTVYLPWTTVSLEARFAVGDTRSVVKNCFLFNDAMVDNLRIPILLCS
ncbi:hypothetical protein [Mycolicibacterium agri]|uniref:hypothetical protein n=1 Tax=Mycolicibacterium agri TaxID=36811 RepID=UPI00105546A7|nr:hypothetical protein [Mycolicibacterium agri]